MAQGRGRPRGKSTGVDELSYICCGSGGRRRSGTPHASDVPTRTPDAIGAWVLGRFAQFRVQSGGSRGCLDQAERPILREPLGVVDSLIAPHEAVAPVGFLEYRGRTGRPPDGAEAGPGWPDPSGSIPSDRAPSSNFVTENSSKPKIYLDCEVSNILF
jgi:hypothetical protein